MCGNLDHFEVRKSRGVFKKACLRICRQFPYLRGGKIIIHGQ